ncbi:MAG: hypothetical protein K8I02_13445 [Candidatus Methylomirabilis sp.]|nr:hypothetical protein [Deltaproteobacteria bacterium]
MISRKPKNKVRGKPRETEAHLPIGCWWTKGYGHQWNSVEDCGCNFVCLAMIIGVDPAYLASTLSAGGFFEADPDFGGLPSDMDKPEVGKSIEFGELWLPEIQRACKVELRRVPGETGDEVSADSVRRARSVLKGELAKSRHVVCGPEHHSVLVAGRTTADFFLFDPDLEDGREWTPGGMWAGHYLFTDMCRNEIKDTGRVEFFLYELEINGVRVKPNSRARDLERVKSRAAT